MAVLVRGRVGDRRHLVDALLDAVRLRPGADLAAITVAQLRAVVERLIAAGQWRHGDPEILVVLDAAATTRPASAYLLADLPVRILGRMRSDRVLRRPTPPCALEIHPADACG